MSITEFLSGDSPILVALPAAAILVVITTLILPYYYRGNEYHYYSNDGGEYKAKLSIEFNRLYPILLLSMVIIVSGVIWFAITNDVEKISSQKETLIRSRTETVDFILRQDSILNELRLQNKELLLNIEELHQRFEVLERERTKIKFDKH